MVKAFDYLSIKKVLLMSEQRTTNNFIIYCVMMLPLPSGQDDTAYGPVRDEVQVLFGRIKQHTNTIQVHSIFSILYS